MPQSIPDTILMTADTIGGVWTYALNLCRALQKFDIQVHLATMGEPLSPDQWKAVKKVPNIEIEESTFALEWMPDPWEDVDEAGQWLIELEQRIQPDLIHLNNYAHGNLCWQAPVLMVGHSCVLSWWKSVKKEQAPAAWNRYAVRVKEGLQNADHITSISRYMLERLNSYYGPFSNSSVIYNARNANDFYCSAKEPLIFSMGRLWDEAKNIAALKEIAEGLPWPVYAAGDNGQESSDRGNITFLGKIASDDIAKWLSKAAIYVMPARYEPFGLSILEAALSECALILGDIPSLREIWDDAALYANPDEPADLQSQIQCLVQNDTQRKRMAEKARQQAQRYSTERFARRYVELYTELLFQKRASARLRT
jgi:glycosyltransferase involved in cell wall biosynthesis